MPNVRSSCNGELTELRRGGGRRYRRRNALPQIAESGARVRRLLKVKSQTNSRKLRWLQQLSPNLLNSHEPPRHPASFCLQAEQPAIRATRKTRSPPLSSQNHLSSSPTRGDNRLRAPRAARSGNFALGRRSNTTASALAPEAAPAQFRGRRSATWKYSPNSA
jgi:hypothetical protein